jgi:protoheme IX farnesyltransferase
VAIAPSFTGLGSWVYLAVSVLGGAMFLLLALRVLMSGAGDDINGAEKGLYGVKAGSKDARNLFAFSILYLTSLFASLLVEHVVGLAPLHLLGGH